MEENNYTEEVASSDNKLTLEEFEEKFWEYIPEVLVNNVDIDENRDWSDMIVHEAWRIYVYSNMDKNYIFKIIEQVVFAYKRYKPVFRKIEK